MCVYIYLNSRFIDNVILLKTVLPRLRLHRDAMKTDHMNPWTRYGSHYQALGAT